MGRLILFIITIMLMLGCNIVSESQKCAESCKNNGGMANYTELQGGCHKVCVCMDAIKNNH